MAEDDLAREDIENAILQGRIEKKLPFCEDFHIHTIELPKFLASVEKVMTPLEYWTYFLKYGKTLDAAHLPTGLKKTPVRKAVKELKMFTQSEKARGLYESRLKAAMDERSKMHDKYQIGLQEGEELGIKKGRQEGEELGIKKGEELGIKKGEELGRREAAIHGLKMGLDTKTLHKLTKIPVAEIEKMRREMDKH